MENAVNYSVITLQQAIESTGETFQDFQCFALRGIYLGIQIYGRRPRLNHLTVQQTDGTDRTDKTDRPVIIIILLLLQNGQNSCYYYYYYYYQYYSSDDSNDSDDDGGNDDSDE